VNGDPWNAEAGILSGPEISEQVAYERIKFSPEFDDNRLNPASYDLLLGRKVAVYKDAVDFIVGGRRYEEQSDGTYCSERYVTLNERVLNMSSMKGDWLWPKAECILSSKRKHEVVTFEMNPDDGWLLKPGIGYLMHTADRICTDDFVPVLDGKSSLGRLFMTAHVTAGYGDPGFDGQYTLEVVVTQPVIVYPGMRFCQIRFHTLVGRRADYKKSGGHYVGAFAEGPVPSMSWK
jgi:deoxycytidine triphosphate deaminase